MPHPKSHWTRDAYIKLLRDYNQQRNKTVAERVREQLIGIDLETAYKRLRDMRDKSVYALEHNGIQEVILEGFKQRHKFSDDKSEHIRLILQIVKERKEWWPLSCRGAHYPLLNFEFVRGYLWPHRGKPGHGEKQTLWYQNDDGSYDATCDLITRLRLNSLHGVEPSLPFAAFDDPTRPLKEFRAFNDARSFVAQEVRNLFNGYWRNLLQSQPN